MRFPIADGDKEFREQAQAFLLLRGHDVKAATDGLEFVEIRHGFVLEIVQHIHNR